MDLSSSTRGSRFGLRVSSLAETSHNHRGCPQQPTPETQHQHRLVFYGKSVEFLEMLALLDFQTASGVIQPRKMAPNLLGLEGSQGPQRL